MIIVDTELARREAEGNPIRVGLVGAGYMGRGIAVQIEKYIKGMKVVAISNRTLGKAEQAYTEAGVDVFKQINNVAELDDMVTKNRYVVTQDPELLCRSETIDALIESTGDVELGVNIALRAIENNKHIVLMNAELDATVGPILKVYADREGVVITNADGDQPGVMMNLVRFVRSIGYRPVLSGNIKGLQDRYRTPETQKGFAEAHGISPQMATSFADGTKISMENAVVANATGFTVGRRGMYGPRCKHVNEAVGLFPAEEMLGKGLVDYVLGAEPSPGVFVIGYNDDPVRQGYMKYFKMGEGPFYVFYTPYHLPHLEVPLTAARAVLFRDCAVTPLGAPVCEVMTVAKRNLSEGEILDGIGGFTSYGVIEKAEICRAENFLPMGLSGDCRLRKDINKDQPLTFDDVLIPQNRKIDQLWTEQKRYFLKRN